MQVVGTAGHVDHGKSTLVRALTGIDPDRLAEEKARGMTIDLGFAWLTLPSGREISIVDVPGHERFIKNMLAGVGGIDVALLVVAADEGIMPQTREHLHILDLLGIDRAVVAVTKVDTVEDDWLELVLDETRDALRAYAIRDAPLIPVSAVRGDGLARLIAALDSAVAAAPPHLERGAPRLPIDRVFTLSGHGTVVTGTLLDGALHVGQEVEIQPGGRASRIRGLQSHRQKVTEALPGTRVAVNLAGIATEELRRGDVLALPGSLQPSSTIDARLALLDDADGSLDHDDEVALYIGATEVPARVRLLDQRSLAPGESALVQLRLSEPVAVRRHDRFIVRRPSPSATIGGGEVLDPVPRHHRRFQGPIVTSLLAIEHGSTTELVRELLAHRRIWEVTALAARCQLSVEQVEAAIEVLMATERNAAPRRFGGWISSSSAWEQLVSRVRAVLHAYHQDAPLRAGMPREEMRSRLTLPARPWPDIVTRLGEEGIVTQQGAALALTGFVSVLTAAQEEQARGIIAALEAQPFAPPTLSEIAGSADAELLSYLEEHGKLVRVGDQLAFGSAAYAAMRDSVLDVLHRQGHITVAEVRDAFGASRRYALALLERLDAERVTRRVGDERVLVGRAATPSGDT